MGRLLGEIKTEKPGFAARIDPKDLLRNHIVQPLLDNPRIIRQSGAFIVFGLTQMDDVVKGNEVGDGSFQGIKPENEYRVASSDGKRLLILVKNKDKILGELNSVGINEMSLFPEIAEVTKAIK